MNDILIRAAVAPPPPQYTIRKQCYDLAVCVTGYSVLINQEYVEAILDKYKPDEDRVKLLLYAHRPGSIDYVYTGYDTKNHLSSWKIIDIRSPQYRDVQAPIIHRQLWSARVVVAKKRPLFEILGAHN